jgi:RNA polymerase primary sigma factor
MMTLLDDNTSLDYLKEDICNLYNETEETEVFNQYKTLNCVEEKIKLRNDILMHNQRLVVSIAKYYKNAVRTCFSLEDLIGEGNIGLLKAIDKFDNSTGNRFSTYATYWIKQAISRYITQTDDLIRIPVNLKLLWVKISTYIGDYYSAHNCYPSDKEILGNVSGLSSEELVNYYSYANIHKDILSLNMIVDNGENDDSELQDFIMDDFCVEDKAIQSINESLFENKVDEMLYKGIRKRIITERDAKIFKMRFGFGAETKLTLQTISEEYNMSKERVRQIEGKVLRYFKQPANKIILRAWLNN